MPRSVTQQFVPQNVSNFAAGFVAVLGFVSTDVRRNVARGPSEGGSGSAGTLSARASHLAPVTRVDPVKDGALALRFTGACARLRARQQNSAATRLMENLIRGSLILRFDGIDTKR